MGSAMRSEGSKWDDCFYGSVTVGERGQVVIPAEARNELGIKPGDKLLVMKHPFHKGLVISNIESMIEFVDEFSQRLEAAREHQGGDE